VPSGDNDLAQSRYTAVARVLVRVFVLNLSVALAKIVFGYASVDLLAERLQPTVAIDELSVSAFLRSRPYMTDRAAAAYDGFITMVWSLPSYLTSAPDYQAFLGHCLAEPTPAFWLARVLV